MEKNRINFLHARTHRPKHGISFNKLATETDTIGQYTYLSCA